jgi:hypothetical protein
MLFRAALMALLLALSSSSYAAEIHSLEDAFCKAAVSEISKMSLTPDTQTSRTINVVFGPVTPLLDWTIGCVRTGLLRAGVDTSYEEPALGGLIVYLDTVEVSPDSPTASARLTIRIPPTQDRGGGSTMVQLQFQLKGEEWLFSGTRQKLRHVCQGDLCR